jgi:Pregnancy-associated plasma protein-A
LLNKYIIKLKIVKKTKIMKKLFISVSVLFLTFSCQKEEVSVNQVEPVGVASTVRRCASQEVLAQKLKEDPSLAKRMQDIENFTKNAIATGRIVNGKIQIPVVFNVIYRTATENVSQAQLQSQIDVLNKDFNALNSDFNTPNNPYAAVRADVGISFVLDQVIRKQTTKRSWSEADVNNDRMKRSATGGINATSPTTKLNVWIVGSMPTSQGETLGYAQFPGGPTATDGVVFAGKFTGTIGTAQAPYNLGRTATHEVGHWMNLRHIWGDANCGSDSVADTPTHSGPNFGVPAVGSRSSCSGTPLLMYMNYMDYTDDRGMYMFSNGQKARMSALFVAGGIRASFRN